jgi:DNA-binding protein HU-beta
MLRQGAIALPKGEAPGVECPHLAFFSWNLHGRLGAGAGRKAVTVHCLGRAVPQSSTGKKDSRMSKAFIAGVIQDSTNCTGVAANAAAGSLIEAIVKELKKEGGFTLPSFGTFTVKKTKARKAMNPRTGEPVKVKAGKTVRFKASPNLKKAV